MYKLVGKKLRTEKKIFTHELRLLFASNLPIGSILKMLSLNRMQLEDLNLCKKLHNYGAVELTVHIRVVFVSSLHHSVLYK